MTDTDKPKEVKRRRPKRKFSLEFWLSITNLVLTAIIGIGIALYLNARNENFQKQLIDIQNNAKLANIEITYKDVILSSGIGNSNTNGYIIIKNNGPAVAENLRVAICMKTVNEQWRESINDISQFNITIDDISRKYKPEISKSECGTDVNFNTLSVDIDSLSPQESISFTIKGAYAILDRQLVGGERNVHILIPIKGTAINGLMEIDRSYINSMSDDELSKYVSNQFEDYITSNYYAATFTASASCNNCVTTSNSGDATIYTVEYMQIKEVLVSLQLIPIDLISRNEKVVETTFNLNIAWYAPKNYDKSNDNLPLYLLESFNLAENLQDSLKEVDKSTYESAKQ